MGSANIDPAAILNRALEYAAQNLRVEKLLIQLGLDPANISYDVVFNRMVDIALANINFANMLALVDGVKDHKALVHEVAREHLAGIETLFQFDQAQDFKDATLVIGALDQGGAAFDAEHGLGLARQR